MKIIDPVTKSARDLPISAVDAKWFIDQVAKAGISPSIAASIINQETRWKAFSTLGPTIAWNQNHFDRLAIKAESVFTKLAVLAGTGIDNNEVAVVSSVLIKAAAANVQKTLKFTTSQLTDWFNKSQSKAWVTLLSHAGAIDNGMNSALSSTAIGLGQVLLSNFKLMGYDSPLAMYNASWDPKEQVRHIIAFLKQPAVLPLAKLHKLGSLDSWSDTSLIKMEQLAAFYAGPKWRAVYPEWPVNVSAYADKYKALGYK